MPIYFFHLRGPAGLERDESGIDFPNIEAAFLDAYRTIPALSAELIGDGLDPFRYAFEIADGDGNPLLEVPFSEPIIVERQPPKPMMQAQRTDDLAIAVERQVEKLQAQIGASRAWIDAVRAKEREAKAK